MEEIFLREKSIKYIERNIILINYIYDAIQKDYKFGNPNYIGASSSPVKFRRLNLLNIENSLININHYSKKKLVEIIKICEKFEFFINNFIGHFIYDFVMDKTCKLVTSHEKLNILHSIIVDTMKPQDTMFSKIDEFIKQLIFLQNN